MTDGSDSRWEHATSVLLELQWFGRGNIFFLRNLSKNYDIILLCETWLKPDSDFNFILPGFVEIVSSRKRLNHRARRGAGGVLMYIRNEFADMVAVEHMECEIEDRLWIRIVRNNENVFLGVWYMPPKGTTGFYGSHTYWESLSEELSYLQDRGKVIIAGDFNARTATMCPRGMQQRVSQDKATNDFGKYLLDLCNQHELRILNGLVDKEHSCNYTCVTPRGASVVDYVVISNQMLQDVMSFVVNPVTTLSDHCYLSVMVNLRKNWDGETTLHRSEVLLLDIEGRCEEVYSQASTGYKYRWCAEKRVVHQLHSILNMSSSEDTEVYTIHY